MLIVVAANLGQTASEDSCWRMVRDKKPMDYVTYIGAFLLPHFTTVCVMLGYMAGYMRLGGKEHSLFLLFPGVGIPFMLYYLVLKLMVFVWEYEFAQYFELVFLVEPVTHALVFLVVLRRIAAIKASASSDMTLREETNVDSFAS